jgi:hypothetical protein
MFRGEYFWVLFLVLGLFGAFRIRSRLKPMVLADPSLGPGARVLLRTFILIVLILVGVNGLLQHFGGFGNDPGWWARDIRNPYVLADFIFLCIWTIVLLWWTWLANGPARLLKFRAAFSAFQNPMLLGETGLKWFLTIVSLLFMTMRIVDIVNQLRGAER